MSPKHVLPAPPPQQKSGAHGPSVMAVGCLIIEILFWLVAPSSKSAHGSPMMPAGGLIVDSHFGLWHPPAKVHMGPL